VREPGGDAWSASGRSALPRDLLDLESARVLDAMPGRGDVGPSGSTSARASAARPVFFCQNNQFAIFAPPRAAFYAGIWPL
jgi:hypothetical protein